MAPRQLNFITGNKNKLIEVEAILGATVDLQSKAIDLVEIQGTIEEISADKCRRAAEAVESFSTNLLKKCTNLNPGPRPSTCRRHMSLLQCIKRASWAIHVRSQLAEHM
jgi:hypothetical protein